MKTDKNKRLKSFLYEHLTNGYVPPLGAAVIDITRGPPTNRKQKRLFYAADRIREQINPIMKKREFGGVEKILIGMKKPDEQTFKKNGVLVFCGDEKSLCNLVNSNMRQETYMKSYFAHVFRSELEKLGGGGTWMGEFYDPSTFQKISDYTVIVSHTGNIYELIKNLGRFGISQI